jgi:hypothetical protein
MVKLGLASAVIGWGPANDVVGQGLFANQQAIVAAIVLNFVVPAV